MRKESAQCAVGRTRTARASPNPPAVRDKMESVCAAEAFGVPRMCRKQDYTFSSCRLACNSVSSQSHCTQLNSGCGGDTHEKEEVNCLRIIHPRDTLVKNLCSVDLFPRKCWTKALWPMGTPSTFTTPHHSVVPLSSTLAADQFSFCRLLKSLYGTRDASQVFAT